MKNTKIDITKKFKQDNISSMCRYLGIATNTYHHWTRDNNSEHPLALQLDLIIRGLKAYKGKKPKASASFKAELIRLGWNSLCESKIKNA